MYDVITGGAAVSPETVRYFLSLDMKVLTEIIEDFRFLLFCLKLAEEQYSTDVMQLLEMTGMTETVGMVPITNLDEPGGFRIGRTSTRLLPLGASCSERGHLTPWEPLGAVLYMPRAHCRAIWGKRPLQCD